MPRNLRRCTSCHKIAAQQTAVRESNTFKRWLGFATGGSLSPVPNPIPQKQDPKYPVTLNPLGQTPGAAGKVDGPSLAITHWMPEGWTQLVAPNAYDATYTKDLVALKRCMQQVGKIADDARRDNKDVMAALKLTNENPRGFSIAGDCHVHAATFPADPPQSRQNSDGATQPNLQLSPPDPTVGETDAGLTLTAQLVGPSGAALPPVSKMPPDAPPVSIPSNSSLTLSWDPGPNSGCSIIASFPPGVIVPNPQPSGEPSSVGGGSNWLPNESPQGFGPLTEPGVYTFDFDCGFQTDAEVVTETHISLNLLPATYVSPNPPMLMTLFTAIGSNNVEAVDWTSYAYPATSYTDPTVSPGQVPQSDIPAGPSDTVLLSWVADDVVTGSCSFSELGGGASAVSPITDDAGEISITLGSAVARVFQLSCNDLHEPPQLHLLQTKIHQVPSVELNATTTPDTGVDGSTYVDVSGSGFPAGALTPANVIVTLSASCGASPAGTTQASGVTMVGTSSQVQFLIPGLDPGVYYVAVSDLAAGDANFASSNCSELTVTDPVATASQQ